MRSDGSGSSGTGRRGPRPWSHGRGRSTTRRGGTWGALNLLLASDPIPALRGDRLAGSVTEDLGVPYVVVYELLLTGAP